MPSADTHPLAGGHVRVADRLAALGLLAALLLALYALLLHPLFVAPLRAVNADLRALQERQQRAEAALAQLPDVRARLARLQAAGASGGLLAQTRPELGVAALSRHLEQAVAAASAGGRGCAITRRTPLPVAPADTAHRQVSVQVRLQCGMAELARLLHALETGSPRVLVDQLQVIAPAPSAMSDALGLDVGFDASAWLIVAPADDASAGMDGEGTRDAR